MLGQVKGTGRPSVGQVMGKDWPNVSAGTITYVCLIFYTVTDKGMLNVGPGQGNNWAKCDSTGIILG